MNIRHILTKHWQLLALILVLVTIAIVFYTLLSLLLPLILGFVAAYLVFPVISWIEKRLPWPGKWLAGKRITLILLTYIVVLALMGLVAYLIIVTIGQSFSQIIERAPQFFSDALTQVQDWVARLRVNLPPQAQQQLDRALENMANLLGNGLRNLFVRTITFVPTTIGTIFSFVVLPVFLFYLLKDWDKLNGALYTHLSPGMAVHARSIVKIIEVVLGRYIRATLLLGLIVGIMSFIGLSILKVPYAPVLALIAGITEVVPIIGPWLGGAIGVLVTLASAPEKAVWVALIFLLVQLTENHFLAPKIQGDYMHIHPAVAIVLLILGGHYAGFWGLALAVPFTATVVKIYRYFHETITREDIEQND